MSKKLILSIFSDADREAVKSLNLNVIAEYPESVLIQAEDEDLARIEEKEIEAVELSSPPVSVSGLNFSFDAAMAAEESAPLETDSARLAYFLVQFVGPVKEEWLDSISQAGAEVQGAAPGHRVVCGIQPDQVGAVLELPWVEAVTPYRPAMKVASALREDSSRGLGVAELAALDVAIGSPARNRQVEISLFRGESADEIAERVRETGGRILFQGEESVTAIVEGGTLGRIANEQGVQSIEPHSFPELHNDVAAEVLAVPETRIFGDLELAGEGQIVAVADSGIDNGSVNGNHPDFDGRIAGISSPSFSDPGTQPYVHDNLPVNDGAADVHSGHGSHVAGSVLGDGTAAVNAGSTIVPRGVAPRAQLFFQAIEQVIQWKSKTDLDAEGIPVPPNWPPRSAGLYGIPNSLENLFQEAYDAGARIHTNSWGRSDAGVYAVNSALVDRFMFNHRDILILYSAGNQGEDFNGDGVVDLDSIGSPGTAKNCLTVGASENRRPSGSDPSPGFDANWNQLVRDGVPRYSAMGAAGHVSDNEEGMAAFSSRGPTNDGRIKPEVVAPGTNVLSTRTRSFQSTAQSPEPLWGDLDSAHVLHDLYCWSGGTSMSTPLVAGCAALVRQFLTQELGLDEDGLRPSGALLKAMLVHFAVPMAGQFTGEIPPGRNQACGFGRVNLGEMFTDGVRSSLVILDDPDRRVGSGENDLHNQSVANTERPLKVTLVWTDAPSLVGSASGPINKIYLQVKTPSGQVIDGDVTPFPVVTNSVQQVEIEQPEEGTYQVRIRGIEVIERPGWVEPGDPIQQDFALVMTNVG